MSGTGADRLCEALIAREVDRVFGLPGSQTKTLYLALHRAGIRCVNGTHELAACFMANGYARASGRPGVVVTIPGPGLTWALTGLAEARLDSVPVLLVTGAPATSPGQRFQLQALDQAAVLAPLVKSVLTVASPEEVGARTLEALDLTTDGEPGPVVLQVAKEHWDASGVALSPVSPPPPPAPRDEQVAAVAARLADAERPLLYLGQGAAAAPGAVSRLVDRIGALVVTTTSARGAVPEDDPRVLCFDPGDPGTLNAVIDRSDLVLALGCKFSHNGAHGFELRIPPEKLVHVDASPDVLGANYPSPLTVAADVPSFLERLLERGGETRRPSCGWPVAERERWREQATRGEGQAALEPRFSTLDPPTAEGFFAALRRALPRDGVLVTDSGQHQMLARRHHRVLAPRSFIVPTNLQSMGFALPAAIGAALAGPQRSTVVLLGDGGLLMSGLELATAVREGLSLTAVVLRDGPYGQIRLQQLQAAGRSSGTELPPLSLEGLAATTGASYLRLEGDPGPALEQALAGTGVTLVEVPLGDSPGHRRLRARAALRQGARSLGLLGAIRRLRRR